MSFPEARRDLSTTIDVKIGVIEERGNPKTEEIPHNCDRGGVLSYVQGSLLALWNGNRLEVESVWAYRCTEGCSDTLLLPEVSAVIAKHIDEAWAQTGKTDNIQGSL